MADLSEKLQDELSRNDEGISLDLPESSKGVSLSWDLSRDDSSFLLIPAGMLAAVFVWFSRDDREKRMFKNRRMQFENEIPGLSFQLMLHLNAGLIAESALRQVIEQTEEDQGPLYRALREVRKSAALKNVSLITELYAFAKETHSQNMIRLAAMVYEHAGRGSELAEKLEQERTAMWSTRQNNARNKIKEAETRLCFPLILLLVALIIITAAPSFMTM